jgi:enoyl-CoA hydratase/carnithine racemase
MTERKFRTLIAARRVIGAGEVLQLTLNRPERRNAIGPEMINELRWALDDAGRDAAIRVIVLTGAGKAFCAGGDFAQMTSGADDGALPPFVDEAGVEEGGDYSALLLAMIHTPKPIVAKVNGHAMGGGLGLVAAATFAIASTAAQLGTPEVDVGLFPMMIMAVLDRLVPRRRLTSMMLLGERLEAHEAEELGLLNAAVPGEELDANVDALCEKLAAKAPLAIRHGLGALADQDARTLADALPMLRERLGVLLATDDAREGLMAFLEKRAPKWQGR